MVSSSPLVIRLRTPWTWLLIFWMAVIFFASGDADSVHRSSHILEPFLRWIMPQASDPAIAHGVFLCRKCAHLTEYAFLAVLLYKVLRRGKRTGLPPISELGLTPALAFKIILILGIYAASDEFHQTFVPSRYGCALDVFIDTCGGVLGLAGIWVIQRLSAAQCPANPLRLTS